MTKNLISCLALSLAFQASALALPTAGKTSVELSLSNTDARAMFSAMPVDFVVSDEEFGRTMTKRMEVSSVGETSKLEAFCQIIADGQLASCNVRWTLPQPIELGKAVALNGSFSQALVSRVGLVPRTDLSSPELGESVSVLTTSKFGLRCLMQMTPSDLPAYTSCTLTVLAAE